MFGVSGIVGHYGNRVYFNMLHAKIRNSIEGISPRQAIQELRKNGGPNKYGWIAPTLLGVVLSVPGFAIQNERMQDAARAEHQAQIDKAEKAAAEQAAAVERQRLANEQAENASKNKYLAYLARVERQYAFLNPDSPQYDNGAETWVAERLDIYKSQGQNPEQALRSAIADLEKIFEQKRQREYYSETDYRLLFQLSKIPGGISQREATATLCQTSPSACR